MLYGKRDGFPRRIGHNMACFLVFLRTSRGMNPLDTKYCQFA
jgi:hypothetical protein